MRVRLLGTGSADGWPNPFCECGSCTAERAAGRSRGSTSALLDDAVLVDFGPNAAVALRRAGVSLAGVEHLLVTHGHADHLAPDFLLWRSWVAGLPTLHVWGPPAALDTCRHWIGPGDPVELHPVHAGDAFTLRTGAGEVSFRAVPSDHGHGNGDPMAAEAVLYDITAADGDRLLYATDTGPLTAPALDAVAGRGFALVLIEETFGHVTDHGTGHHDLGTLPVTLDALRASGAITGATRVVAIHLSHHNPPLPELAAELARQGVAVHDDGTVLDTRRPTRLRRMVIGGARSGKSTLAESLLASRSDVTYLATGGERPDDGEWTARVAAHRARRPSAWRTQESTDVAGVLRNAPAGSAVLVDCLALWLTAVLDGADAWSDRPGAAASARAAAEAAIDELAAAVRSSAADVVLVTNEVGMDVVPATASGRLFRDLLGIANAAVADACDQVTLVVAGRPLDLPRRQP